MPVNQWKRIKWGDVATLKYGKALRGYRDGKGSIPVYGTNGLIGFTDVPLEDNPGVIVGRKGAYRGVHYSEKPFFVIDTAFYLKSKDSSLDLKWAYYHLLTRDINSLDSGSAIPSTSRDDFYALDLLFPPLPEQKSIAHILSSLDDKIKVNAKINHNLDDVKDVAKTKSEIAA